MADGASSGVIQLAGAAPFDLGTVRVNPPAREVERGGRRVVLEPRVMQALVALASVRPAVVTRDELIARCWDGRYVGDNAIHRVMSRLREVATDLGDGAFRIETIARVGYRLVVDESGSTPSLSTPSKKTPRPAAALSPRMVVAIAVLLGLAGLATALAWVHGSRPAGAVTVSVTGDGGPQSAGFARDVALDVATMTAPRADELSVIDPSASPSDFVARVGLRPGPHARADLELRTPGDSEVLWSEIIEAPAGEADLRGDAAARLGALFFCAAPTARARPGLDATTVRLQIAACMRMNENPDALAGDLLREVVRRAPQDASAWGMLAIADAGQIDGQPPAHWDDSQRLHKAQAEEAIRRARSLEPSSSAATLAEAYLAPCNQWRNRLLMLDRGIASEPGYAMFYDARSQVSVRTGRVAESISDARHAVALNPFSPLLRSDLITSLAYSGQLDAARAELQSAQRTWPNSGILNDAWFHVEFRYGDPAKLRRAVVAGDARVKFEDVSANILALLAARETPTPQNIERAAGLADDARPNRMSYQWRVQVLGQFGQIDEIYQPPPDAGKLEELSWATYIFFRSYMGAVTSDRRFMGLADRVGLTRFWRETGSWPDFCYSPALPYSCKAEAARLDRERTGTSSKSTALR